MKQLKWFLPVLLVWITVSTGLTQVERVEKGNLVMEGVPEIPQQIKDRMQQYDNVRSASVADWLDDGSGLLISTRFGETQQLHVVTSPGGARQQITFFDEPIKGAAMYPDKPAFIFGKDVGGGEFYQLFTYDLETGVYSMITDGTSRNSMGNWTHKGDKFALVSTKRNGRDYDIYIMDPQNPENTQLILDKGGAWTPTDWSADDTKLIVNKYISANESYFYILDVESGELEQINPSDKQISYSGAQWARDGKGIYMTSDEDSEFTRLRYYDLATKSFTTLTPDIDWDVIGYDLSHDGKTLVFVTNEDGLNKLYLMRTADHTFKNIDVIPAGRIRGLIFDKPDQRLAMSISTPTSPSDVFVLDLNSLELERWTHSEVGGLNTDTFIAPKLIHYPTFDQVDGAARNIPAFCYLPEKQDEPLPVIIYIHGGPESQFTPYFSSTFQYWAKELGIAVIAPNVRGSDGYGKSYLKLDNGFKREESVQDIGALLDWIEKQPNLDAERVAVYGGSYGGYMVLASLVHYNDRLKCGVDVVGISNFVTFLENTQEYRRDLRRAEYGDERDEKMRAHLQSISPANHADKITKPLYVIQGLNDPRVPASESEQMVANIRKNGGEVWYLLAKDEGHGFRKKNNRNFYRHSVILFLQEFLLQ